MKCISLWNPWAFLMAIDKKRFETRSWPTSYRGPLAIHAAKRWNPQLELLCTTEPFKSIIIGELGQLHYGNLEAYLPFGQIIAVVDLLDCQKITMAPMNMPSSHEFAFGDYTIGRYVWQTRNVRRINPMPYKGQQGFFDIPDSLVS